MVFFSDHPGLVVILRDAFKLIAQIHLDDLLNVATEDAEAFLDLFPLGPDAVIDQAVFVVREMHQSAKVLPQPDRVDDVEGSLPGPAGGQQAEDDVIKHFGNRPLGGPFRLQKQRSLRREREGQRKVEGGGPGNHETGGVRTGSGMGREVHRQVRERQGDRSRDGRRPRVGRQFRPPRSQRFGSRTDGGQLFEDRRHGLPPSRFEDFPADLVGRREFCRFGRVFRIQSLAAGIEFRLTFRAFGAVGGFEDATFGIHGRFIARRQTGDLSFDFLLRGGGKIGIHCGHPTPLGLDLLGDAFLPDFEPGVLGLHRFLRFLLEPPASRCGLLNAIRKVFGRGPGALHGREINGRDRHQSRESRRPGKAGILPGKAE